MVAQTNLLAGAAVHAATRPSYTWSKGAMDGGGYCNAMATDPINPGCAAAAGDVWGEFATRTGGGLWYPTMTGATSIGAIYGRAVAYSRKTPGLRYFGIGVLKNASNQGYLGAVAGDAEVGVLDVDGDDLPGVGGTDAEPLAGDHDDAVSGDLALDGDRPWRRGG